MATRNIIRVFIVDDHTLVRAGLKQIIALNREMTVVGEAGSEQEALRALRTTPCDVLLLDVTLPGGGGLELLREVKQIRPSLPVLMLSVHEEKEYAIRSLKLGAAGYLTKKSAPDELISALETAARGRKYVTAALAEDLAMELEAGVGDAPHKALSDREFQVLCVLAEGKMGSEIAKRLKLSPKTISTYRTRILDKMGMKTNAELMRYVIEHKLAD